jgi:hypothetical protein
MNEGFKNHILINFLIVCGSFLFFHYIIDLFYFTDGVILASYSEKYSNSKVEALMGFRKDWYWLSYLAFPVFFAIKSFVCSSPIFIGLYLSRIEVSFISIFNTVVTAQIVFIAPELIKFFWFMFHPISFENLRSFYPLSLFSLFDADLLQEWLYYPLKVMNLFELGYWLFLADLLANQFNQSFNSMLKLVLLYYVSFLFCWVAFVMFISLGNS